MWKEGTSSKDAHTNIASLFKKLTSDKSEDVTIFIEASAKANVNYSRKKPGFNLGDFFNFVQPYYIWTDTGASIGGIRFGLDMEPETKKKIN